MLSPGGTIRRVLDGGRIDPGPGDATHGSGVLIDVTENSPVEGSPSLLETALGHLLIARRSLVGAETAPATRVLLNALLLELGRELARRMDTPSDRPRT